MPHEAPVPIVLDGRGFETLAKRVPRGLWVEREAWFGLGDRYDELRAKSFTEARGDDKPALFVKSMFGTTRKARNIASQGKTSTSPHQAPLSPTIPWRGSPMQETDMKDMSLQRLRFVSGEGAWVVRFVASLALLGALYGCGGGGFVPGGPHSMNAATLKRLVSSGARANQIPPELIAAMVQVESHGDPAAVSRAGAQGLMQLMPDTAATYGVLNSFDPEENVSGGCRYMHDLLARYHHNVPLALAAYNAGPGAVDAFHGIPPFGETRAYVARVTSAARSTTN